MNDDKHINLITQQILSAIGNKPFNNLKDIRNRRKIATAIETILNEYDINQTEIDKVKQSIINYKKREK